MSRDRRRRALTERILDRLGRPRWMWMLAWALVQIPSAALVVLVAPVTGVGPPPPSVADLALPTAVSAYSVVLFLWGVDRLMADIRALEPRPTGSGRAPANIDDRVITNPVIPLLLAATLAGLAGAETLARHGPVTAAAVFPLEFVYHIPVASFGWTYLAFLVELDRLGRRELALDAFPQDRGLGLAPLGSVAFTGFVIVVAYLVPTTVVNVTDVYAVIQLAVGVAVILIAFVASMWRLHRQMHHAKAAYVGAARRLYAEAYAPIRADATLHTLQAQAPALGAAQDLEQRAQSIYEWPIDEPTTARLAIIVTGIITGVMVRIVGTGLGV